MPNREEFQVNYPRAAKGALNKGVARMVRANKRNEAELRKLNTPFEKTRAYWRTLGFTRQSVAAKIVKGAVAEGQAIVDDLGDRDKLWSKSPDLTSALRHSAEGKTVDLGDFTQYA